MSIVDKLKFLFQLNKLYKEIKMLDKIKAGLSKLDGMKSVLGLLGVVAYYAAPNFGLHLPDAVLNISSGLAGIGLMHKLEKGTGVLNKTVAILTAVKTVADKVNEELKKKEEEKK